jgi:hypothetical protein
VANETLTADIIAKEAVMILENNMVMAKQVHRGYDNEFSKKVNGYEVGETVSIRRPTDFTVRTTMTASAQDVVEGKIALTVDQPRGVDFAFTSTDLTLQIGELSERVIKPAMVQLANSVDAFVHSLYTGVPNWVGTPGQTINSYTDFGKAPERLSEMGVPLSDRSAVLSPADNWGLLGSQTGLFIQDAAKGAYREGSLGKIGGVDTFETQNVATHTTGTFAGTTLVKGASQVSAYATVKDTMTQNLIVDGFTSATPALKAGDVFTIADVYAVNPVSKATLPFLKQFTVTANVTGSANEATMVIYPAIITSGAFQNVSAAPADNAAVTFLGTQSTNYRQNLVFHKNAFALVSVPLVKPPGAVEVGRQSYKGVSVRIIPFYNGSSDVSTYRCDILFGGKAIDPRLATRLSGTA